MKLLPGVRTPHHKNTAVAAAVPIPIPKQVRIPMSMHVGAAAKLVAAVGDTVTVGQLIGEANGAVSAPVHSSVSGVVSAITDFEHATGEHGLFITINTDGEQTPFADIKPPSVSTTEEFLAAVRASGVVGLGGAGFPMSVKLAVDPSRIEMIIINGAECEPYITSDTRTMIDDALLIAEGVQLLKKYLKAPEIVIAVEENKQEAISVLKKTASAGGGFTVKTLPPLYPQGGEKMLIYNVAHRAVPEGKLPIDAGCIVVNVTSLAEMARYIKTGMPLVTKRVTVDGSAVKTPRNVFAPIGTPAGELLNFCGTEQNAVKKLLFGGPMMGAAQPDYNLPIRKTTNAVIAFAEADSEIPPENPCIRCGRCVRSCPMRLMTVDIQNAYLANKPELLAKYKTSLCIECGCCTFACPAKRPLTQYMRLAKAELRKYTASKGAVK